MTALDSAPNAVRRVLAAHEELAAAQAARDALLVDVRAEGVPARQVGPRVRERLYAAGFTVEQVRDRRVGVSDGNVRRVLERD